jgi:hypothetical protein
MGRHTDPAVIGSRRAMVVTLTASALLVAGGIGILRSAGDVRIGPTRPTTPSMTQPVTPSMTPSITPMMTPLMTRSGEGGAVSEPGRTPTTSPTTPP